MPIKREAKWHYPIDWPQLSAHIRFRRAGGRCEHCGRPHGRKVKALPDGRWLDPDGNHWRDDEGKPADFPNIEEFARHKITLVILAACHRNHDPTDNRPENLAAWCQRCHLIHDAAHHREQRRITFLLRRALGDLFTGPYQRW